MFTHFTPEFFAEVDSHIAGIAEAIKQPADKPTCIVQLLKPSVNIPGPAIQLTDRQLNIIEAIIRAAHIIIDMHRLADLTEHKLADISSKLLLVANSFKQPTMHCFMNFSRPRQPISTLGIINLQLRRSAELIKHMHRLD